MVGRPPAPANISLTARCARRRARHEVAQAPLERRHVVTCDNRAAIRVDDREPGDAAALDIGIDRRRGLGGDEARPVGGHDQQIAQIAGLRRLLRHLGAIAAGQRQFGHVELQRRVLRQAADRIRLAVQPIGDGRRPGCPRQSPGAPAIAAGRARAPARQAQGQHHAGRGDQQQSGGGGNQTQIGPAALAGVIRQVDGRVNPTSPADPGVAPPYVAVY